MTCPLRSSSPSPFPIPSLIGCLHVHLHRFRQFSSRRRTIWILPALLQPPAVDPVNADEEPVLRGLTTVLVDHGPVLRPFRAPGGDGYGARKVSVLRASAAKRRPPRRLSHERRRGGIDGRHGRGW